MASGGVGSNVVYSGTVEHVVKGYGFISLRGGNPVPKAFFDRSSVGRALYDLTEHFQKGCKVTARIGITDGEHKVKYKALGLRLENPDDSSIKGGDQYLKKYLESHHRPIKLEELVQNLSVSKDNCPRFLKRDGVNGVKRVVLYRPDWFEIQNDALHFIGHESKSVVIPVDESTIRGGDLFLKKYLEDNGAVVLEKLVEDLKGVKSNCPKFLRRGDVNEVKKVVTFKPEWFQIRSNFLCLTVVEKELVDELVQNLPLCDNAIEFQAINGIIRPDHKHRRYLHTSGQWNVGVKDFISRNAQVLVYWKEAIRSHQFIMSNAELKKEFCADMMAVKYYSKFVTAKGPLPIRSLSGHFNQATSAVKAVTKPKDPDFREFLERNSMFFVLQGDAVKECPPHRLSIIDKFWLKNPRKSIPLPCQLPIPLPRSSSNSSQPLLPNPKTPERRTSQQEQLTMLPKIPVQVSKAFSDAEGDIVTGKSTRFQPVSPGSHVERFHFGSSTQSQPSLLQSQEHGTTSLSGDVFALPEAQVFKKLVGYAIAQALEDEILSSDTLNSLLLIRFNIGKPPMAKFRIPDEGGGFNQSLKVEPVKVEDLQRMLRQDEVKKMDTPSHYGIKGTLHSIRTMERGGTLSGLTLFCQLHETNDGLGLDIWKGKKLTAVFNGNYPLKYIYNYLRCKSEKLSRRGDLLVVDVDGQLSGCDVCSHPSLGDVTRMLCSSSSELSQAITESIQHMHEYVVIIGIDSTEHLKALQKMCGKGTQVIAEVLSDLKTDVESLFL